MSPKMWVPEVGRAWQVGTLSALWRVCSWGLQQFHPSHNFWPCKATSVVAAIHMTLPLSFYLFFPFPMILGLPKDHFRVSQPPDVLHVDISYILYFPANALIACIFVPLGYCCVRIGAKRNLAPLPWGSVVASKWTWCQKDGSSWTSPPPLASISQARFKQVSKLSLFYPSGESGLTY